MVVSGHNLFPWNWSTHPSALHLYIRPGVACWMYGHCCCLGPDESQPWKWYFATVVWNLVPCCPRALWNPLPVTCYHAVPSLSPRWRHCTDFQKHFDPFSLNSCCISKMLPRQPVLYIHQKICNDLLLGQGSITKWVETVLSPVHVVNLFLQIRSQQYFLPLVKCTKVELPHPVH